jgi:hypothetical protein
MGPGGVQRLTRRFGGGLNQEAGTIRERPERRRRCRCPALVEPKQLFEITEAFICLRQQLALVS